MFRDVTVGQYYSVDSVVHRLDPRVKIRFVLVYILLLLIDRNLPQFLLLTAVLVLAVVLSGVPVKHMLKGSRSIYIFIAVCSLLDIFTTAGTVLVKLGSITITYDGLIKAGFVFWRMVLIILMSSLLMYTTTPSQLTDGFEKCFHMSGNVAMGITIGLRFIPILFGELQNIMKAQEARGACFNEGGPVKRLKALRTVIVPLFQSAIDKAGHLGDAMDARCYTGGKGRTKLRPLVYKSEDILVYAVMLVLVAAGVWLVVKF
jgi:energy-coupling factor transport system permease protein